jgi:hypothetical protein
MPLLGEDRVISLPFLSAPAKTVIDDSSDRPRFFRGTHLAVDRTFYTHHGVYWGWGKVIHHSGFSTSFAKGPITYAPLEEFASGGQVYVVEHENPRHWKEIVTAARLAAENTNNPE